MLSPTLLYLLKANGALLLFALAYFGLLRRLTFFTLNRYYLLFALLFSAVYPALPVPALLPPVAAAPVAVVLVETAAGPTGGLTTPAPTDWNAVALAVYGAGVALGLLRLLVQLLSLARLRRLSRPALVSGVAVRVLPGEVSPFSFGPTIYLNPAQHPAPELAAVLRHEQVHVRHWHTLDVLLAHLAQAGAWCNPAAWLLRRALLDNLEFLADHAALQSGLDRRAYQYSLLRLSQAQPGPALVSHFTFPTLKNRVAMMNTPLSSTGQLARYFVAGPLVLAAALGFSGARAQGAGPVVPVAAHEASAQPDREHATDYHITHYLDGKVSSIEDERKLGAENVASMVALKGEDARKISGNPQDEYVMVMTSKQNQNRPDVLAFNQKVAAAEARAASTRPAPAPAPAARRRPAGQPSSVRTVQGVRLASAPASSAAPAASQPSGPPPVYYVDGKVTRDGLANVAPDAIASVNVFKGEKTRELAGNAGAAGVVVITTKQRQDAPEVRAFNEKLGIAASPPAPAASVPYLAAPALAYITQHYPAARLLGVSEVKAADATPLHYQANIVMGRRPAYLLFDAQGQFISESYTSYLK
ncbi:M56 family metallopeptidase [Hymenobacter sp. 5317J-9]|uniref:M56 family metallopeptidase n=1 Tax=Hymenobacter sp. 5317J-9 TaxID=2932250 RepID=UPI001FD68391|nr:M56 family metallopeptidase [Hymenobacter sp. 5317J-9]UOQ97775.1 M56 family metallopeptidase [Hymenobacter sp. 5317J-9]